MGYELDRLMSQYGVSSPTSTGFGTPAENAAYTAAYNSRVANTPQYLQGQYKTESSTPSTAPTFSAGSLQARNAGVDLNKDIQNWVAGHPNASQVEIAAAMSQFKVNDRDVRNAMGTGFRYGKPDDPANYAPGYTGSTGATSMGYGSAGMNATGNPALLQQQIRDWQAAHPNATDAEIRAAQSQFNVSNRDVYDATGNFWGNTLKPPTPVSPVDPGPGGTGGLIPGYTNQQVIDWIRGKTPEQVAQQAASLGLTANQIHGAYALNGQTVSLAEIAQYDADHPEYWFDSSGRLHHGAGGPAEGSDGSGGSGGSGGGGGSQIFGTATDQAGAAGSGGGGLTAFADPGTSLGYLNMGDAGAFAGGYAKGGRVRTHFQVGGLNQLTTESNEIPSMGNREPTPQELSLIQADAKRNNIQSPFINLSGEPEPQVPAPTESREAHLLAMLSKYQPKESAYAAEYQAARGKSNRETQAFQDMLQKAIEGQQDQGPSQSEKYFRLAAAFGAPTRTGHFGETMANAAGVLGDFNKEQRLAQRAGQSQALQLGLQGQQARMAAAKEDLNSLRSLTGEEMKDKRTITTELIKDYVASGKPQSTAGKQAIDEGLVQGTAPYQKRVAEIANLNVEKQMAQINSAVSGMTVAQANLTLAQNKFEQQQAQAAKLTPTELKLKTETEDFLANLDLAKADLKQAFALNPNTFDSSPPDKAQREVLEAAGSKDKKLLDTRFQENLLTTGAISQLREKFGSQFTQAEGKLWIDLQGVGAKSIEERARIMANMYKVLAAKAAIQQKRLNEIKSGAARNTTPTEEGIE